MSTSGWQRRGMARMESLAPHTQSTEVSRLPAYQATSAVHSRSRPICPSFAFTTAAALMPSSPNASIARSRQGQSLAQFGNQASCADASPRRRFLDALGGGSAR